MKKYCIVDRFNSVWNVGSYEFIYSMYVALNKKDVIEFELIIKEF